MVNPLIWLASLLLAPSESVRNLNQRFNFSTEGFKLIRGSHANKEPDTSINQSGVGGLLREDVYSWRPHIQHPCRAANKGVQVWNRPLWPGSTNNYLASLKPQQVTSQIKVLSAQHVKSKSPRGPVYHFNPNQWGAPNTMIYFIPSLWITRTLIKTIPLFFLFCQDQKVTDGITFFMCRTLIE